MYNLYEYPISLGVSNKVNKKIRWSHLRDMYNNSLLTPS
jgi:hypothetical protein